MRRYKVTWRNKEGGDWTIVDSFEEAEELLNDKKLEGCKVRIERFRRPGGIKCRGNLPRSRRFRRNVTVGRR